MIETGNVLYRIQYFFGTTSFLILFICALLYIYLVVEKQYRKMFVMTALCFLLVFNDITFALVKHFNASGEYYRFFWMIPVSAILAVMIAYLFTKADTIVKKGFALLIIGMMILTSGPERNIPDVQIHRIDNIYGIPEETMEIIQLMDEDREGDSAVVLCTEEMIRYLRVYDGAYISAVPRSIYRTYADFDVSSANVNEKRAWILLDSLKSAEHDSNEVKEALIEAEIRYIICRKDCVTEDYEAFGGILLGESTQYRVYKLL